MRLSCRNSWEATLGVGQVLLISFPLIASFVLLSLAIVYYNLLTMNPNIE
jgi:hypothetical protein